MRWRIELALVVALTAGRAMGQPDPGAEEPNAAEPEPHSSDVVVVVLVGSVGHDAEFVALLTELLAYQKVAARFVRRPTLSTSELFQEHLGDESLWVFLALRTPHLMDLTFRDTTSERFLLRELPLPRGLDTVGREQTAQVVESSVTALLRTNAGMSREQARTAIASRQVSAPEVPREPSPPVPRAPLPAVQRSVGWRSWIAARYGAGYHGPDLGIAHGPGLEVGVLSKGTLFGGPLLLVEQRFPQKLRADPVGAELITLALWFAPEVGWAPNPHHMATLSLGVGAETTRIRPTSTSTTVTLADASRNWVPATRAELRYELHGEHLTLGFGAGITVPLVDTHYDLEQLRGTTRVAEPGVVVPSVSLLFAWSPLRDTPAHRTDDSRAHHRSRLDAGDTGE